MLSDYALCAAKQDPGAGRRGDLLYSGLFGWVSCAKSGESWIIQKETSAA